MDAERKATRQEDRPPTDPAKLFVLVIEDAEDGRSILDELFRAEGYRVESAENGEAALARLGVVEGEPFIALVDLNMPVMDGWEFCRRAAQEPKLRSVPIWLISASEVSRPFPAGVQGIMRKPFEWTAVQKATATAWEVRKCM